MLAQEKVAAIATVAQASGAWMVFATYTIRHSRSSSLRELLDQLNGAYRKSQQGKAFQKLSSVYGYVGGTKAVEVRWSSKHGWHPHLHVVHFFRARESDALAGARAMVERYREQVSKLGGYASPAAQDVKSCYDPSGAGKYATKGACELTNSGGKSYDNSRNLSLSPFDLLRFSCDPSCPRPRRALLAALFREYCQSMAGKPLCRVSSRLTAEFPPVKSEHPPQEQDQFSPVALHINSVVVRRVFSAGRMGELYDALRACRVDDIRGLRDRVVWYCRVLGIPGELDLLVWSSGVPDRSELEPDPYKPLFRNDYSTN